MIKSKPSKTFSSNKMVKKVDLLVSGGVYKLAPQTVYTNW